MAQALSMPTTTSNHARLAEIRSAPQGADERFLLRIIWQYDQAMRAAYSELDLRTGAENHSREMYALNARRILRDALADKTEHETANATA